MALRTTDLQRTLAIATMLIGGLAIVGLVADVPALLRVSPMVPPITLAGALALVAAGIGLYADTCDGWRLRRAVVGVGAGLLVGGLAMLLQIALGQEPGALLRALQASLPGGHGQLGRIAPGAASTTALYGLALLALRYADRRPVFLGTMAVVAATASMSACVLVGYLLDIEFLFTWADDIPVPAHTTAGHALIAAGLGCALWRRRRDAYTASPQRRIQLVAVAVLTTVAIVSGIATFGLAQHEYQSLAKDQMHRQSRDRRANLAFVIEEHRRRVSLLAHRPIVRRVLADFAANPADPLLAARLRESSDWLLREGFLGWRYQLPSGPTVESGALLQEPDLAVELDGPDRTWLEWKDGAFAVRTVVEVREGDRLLAIATAEEPLPELGRIRAEAESWGATGEMAICASAGEQMRCFPMRSNARPALFMRHAAAPLPMMHALDGDSGVAEMLDYRQRRVLAAYGPVGGTGLGMVTKIDLSELDGALGVRVGQALLVLATMVIAGVVAMRRQLAPLTDALVAAQEEAKRNGERFIAAAESSLDANVLLEALRDDAGAIVDFRLAHLNASAEVLIGRPSAVLLGRTVREVLQPDRAAFLVGRYRSVVESGRSVAEEFETQEVAARWVAHQVVKLGDGVAVTARDITERKQLESRLRAMAEYDLLTGLPNRNLFFDRLEQALLRARRDHKTVAVLYVDLDRFKEVNDTWGHAAGDLVLREFATRVRIAIRACDTFARLGGDEFAVILDALAAPTDAERVADAILDALAEPFDVGVHAAIIGASIGIATAENGDTQADALVARADQMLYAAKHDGRHTFRTEKVPG